MKKSGWLILITVMTMGLLACSNNAKQNVGTATGAVAGGLLGSVVGGGTGKLVAVGVGAVAGALLGSEIGQQMDENDNARIANTMEHNVTSQPAYWGNDKTGGKYMIVPESNWMTVNGNPHCRRYASTAYINGQKRHIHGVACKLADGTWHVVKQ